MSLLESLNGTGGLEDLDVNAPNVPWEKGAKFAYMNTTKKFVLSKYPKVFGNLRLSDVKQAPILLTRQVLMKKIEEIYNEQTRRVLRKKSLAQLNIPLVTREYMDQNVQGKKNSLIQSLSTLIYSADKFGDYPENAQYLKFLVGPTSDLTLMFYLYIRTNFKIITYNSFLNNKVTGKNPIKIDMSYSDAMDVIDQAFYYNAKARKALKDGVRTVVKAKQRITYYKFMTAIMEVNLAYGDLELMHHLILLYRVKVPEDIIDTKTLTQGMKGYRGLNNGGNGDAIEAGGAGGDQELGGDDFDFEGDDMQKDNRKESVSGMFGSESGEDIDSDIDSETDEEAEKGAGNGGMLDDLEDEGDSMYLEDKNLIRKYKQEIKMEDMDLQKEIRKFSTRVIQQYITNFLENNETATIGPAKRQQIFDKLWKKIYNLNTVIFYNDKPTYFDLLRVGKKHKPACALWDDMARQYAVMAEMDDPDQDLIVEFLNSWLRNELVQSNTDFFLEYEYRVPNPIVENALKVDAEIGAMRTVIKKKA